MANKAFLKRWSLRRSDGVFPGPPPTGACCKNDGTCEILTEDECNALAGSVYKGDDVLCADANCDPAGACCTGTDCNQYTSEYCTTDLGGIYHGDGVDCADPSCPESNVCITTGSCCYYDTSIGEYGCLDCLTETECSDLSTSTTNKCDLVWKESTDCSTASCGDIGRCCYHISEWESGCTNITESECTVLDGHWDTDKACDTCGLGGASENCPTGRCCVATDDGSLSLCQNDVTQVTCEFWGELGGYSSEWISGESCDGTNPCGFGLCCDGGVCKGPVFESQCPDPDGLIDGTDDTSVCRTDCNRCLLGACCNATLESCNPNINECDCIDSGVDWEFFPNEDCGPPLPCIPVGACCSENPIINDWQCSVGTEAACLQKNNPTYLGDDTNCTPLDGNLARCTKMSCTNCIPTGCYCQAVPCMDINFPDPDACNDCCTSNDDCTGPC